MAQIDQLQSIFALQEKLMEAIRSKTPDQIPELPANLHNKHVQVFCKDIISRCQDELWEAKYHLKKAKAHRDTSQATIDNAAFLEELVDSLHYFVELLIISGVSADQLYVAYTLKNAINHKRILEEFDRK